MWKGRAYSEKEVDKPVGRQKLGNLPGLSDGCEVVLQVGGESVARIVEQEVLERRRSYRLWIRLGSFYDGLYGLVAQ